MDEQQVRVVQILADVAAKFIFALATAGVFVAMAVKMIRDPSWPVAVVEMFLTGTVYVVFKHYFPAVTSRASVPGPSAPKPLPPSTDGP